MTLIALGNIDLYLQKLDILRITSNCAGSTGDIVGHFYFRVNTAQISANLVDKVLRRALIWRNAVYPQKRALTYVAPQEGQQRRGDGDLIIHFVYMFSVKRLAVSGCSIIG